MATTSATTSPHTLRWYAPHHFVAMPMALIFTGYASWHYAQVAGNNSTEARLWFTLAAVAFLLTFTLVILRQHYALGLQDRLIRLEVRQRYFELTGTSLRPLESQLTLGKITALRFAADEQLPALVQATVSENLTSAAIIQRIGGSYQPDTLRL